MHVILQVTYLGGQICPICATDIAVDCTHSRQKAGVNPFRHFPLPRDLTILDTFFTFGPHLIRSWT